MLAYAFMGFGVHDEYSAWEIYIDDQIAGIITSDEIEDLWWENDFYHVYPLDTIVLIDTCYSYLPRDNPTTPYMAKAFVDYGAKSFTGSTFPLPVYLFGTQPGEAVNSFWGHLSGTRYVWRWWTWWGWYSYPDESVEESGEFMCSYFNNWTYGEEWQTYSDDPDDEIYLE